MSIPAILLPVFVQVALTFALLFWMGAERRSAYKRGEVQAEQARLGLGGWPAKATQVANSFNNQFQIPLLFYVLVILALYTRKADLLFVVLSWIFVISRIVHAGVHGTTNYIPHRFGAYLVGVVVLMIMWIVFAIRILASTPIVS